MTSTTSRKQELRAMAEAIRDNVEAKGTHVFIGTWMDRPGCSMDIKYQSAADGYRVVIHKWDDEDTCTIRYIFGSFWRPKTGREGREYGREENVPFTVDAISDAIVRIAN